MASPDGTTLESFIVDAFYFEDAALYAATIARFEPVRSYIEDALLEYCIEDYEDRPSWRDFRNSLLERAEEALQEA